MFSTGAARVDPPRVPLPVGSYRAIADSWSDVPSSCDEASNQLLTKWRVKMGAPNLPDLHYLTNEETSVRFAAVSS
eukprot:scaffold324405_cov53-Tisochrysis_lutea.AAC.1